MFSRTAGFRHNSIPTGIALIETLGANNGFTVDATENAGDFNDAFLAPYGAVVWLNTTGDALNTSQQAAFERFIQSGGGYVGVHAAADTEYGWPWYGDLLGGDAWFRSHPRQQTAVLDVEDNTHVSTQHLSETWTHFDEWYNFRNNPRESVNVLLSARESSYDPGENAMGDHPMAWYHEFDGGRSWYTNLGHRSATYENSLFQEHLLGGILYALPESIEPVLLDGAGSTYRQDFDTLGLDGLATGIRLPEAWTHGRFGTETSTSFPVESEFLPAALFNAGGANDSDRALAVGVSHDTDDHFLQLLTQVTDNDADSMRLQFAVEAWDARDGVFIPPLDRFVFTPDDPGEAAFHVTVEMNGGNGYETISDFGTVTTGNTLSPVIGGILDGNSDANRMVFDSGNINANIPVGARLRVRWHTSTDAETTGWVFGIDNVVLSLSESLSSGDFDQDGMLDVDDLDALTEHVRSGSGDIRFDVDGSGDLTEADRSYWVSQLKKTFIGDANLDGRVNSGDLNIVGVNWQKTNVTSWSDGDFDGDGKVGSADLNQLGINWQKGTGQAASAVPEPTYLATALLGFVLLFLRQRRPHHLAG